RLKLETYREDVRAHEAEALKGEVVAMAGLRFLTGVNTVEVPDEPLKKPDVTIGNLTQYLSAMRLFRPEVNMARAGVVAPKAQVSLETARLFPDIGIGVMASYSASPSAVMQNNPWLIDPFNRFFYGAVAGFRWNLDLLPAAARLRAAESRLEEMRAT